MPFKKFGYIRCSKHIISIKLNSTPFRPPPTTNQPSCTCIIPIPNKSTSIVIIAFILRYLLVSNEITKATWDSFMAQAKGRPKGENPTSLRYRFPKIVDSVIEHARYAVCHKYNRKPNPQKSNMGSHR